MIKELTCHLPKGAREKVDPTDETCRTGDDQAPNVSRTIKEVDNRGWPKEMRVAQRMSMSLPNLSQPGFPDVLDVSRRDLEETDGELAIKKKGLSQEEVRFLCRSLRRA